MRGLRSEPRRLTADAFVLLHGAALGPERLAEVLASRDGFRCSRARVEQLLAGELRPAADFPWARRFWEKVEKRQPHWGWRGHRDRHGVGMLNVVLGGQRRPAAATRLSLLLHLGEIPDGQIVMRCHDAAECVNPTHLSLGTKSEVAKTNGNALRGERHPLAKLSAEQVRAIRAAVADGETYTALGQRFGVSDTAARDCAIGRRWASLA